MTAAGRNEYLCKKLGRCFHKLSCAPIKDCGSIQYTCERCGETFQLSYDSAKSWSPNIDFDSADGFFFLLRWAKEQDWFIDFCASSSGTFSCLLVEIIDPTEFADYLTFFLKERFSEK